MTLCVGLTGGIGSGKSTASKLFEELGAGIIDTDFIAHQLTGSGGEAIPAIRTAFGDDSIAGDGSLDRSRMRTLIFSDHAAKLKLEQLLHPLILDHVKLQLKLLQSKPYMIIVVPLLPESPAFQQLVQRILVIDCTEENQIRRVIIRSGMSVKEVRSIISEQTPRTKRLELADDVIANDGDLENISRQVKYLHQKYAGLAN